MRFNILWILLFITCHAFSQGINNLWCLGYDNQAGPPVGGFDLNFISGSLNISTVNRKINYGDVSATICDSSGSMLFSSNGTFVVNAVGDTMLNGSGLSPSYYTNNHTYSGLWIPQSVIIIPKPGSSTNYYLIHSTVDDSVQYAYHIYYSEVDMTLDGGMGSVISKNNLLLNDTLNPGIITAVKHANGRDWWLVFHQSRTNKYYIYLLDPFGINYYVSDTIGNVRRPANGQSCFSPDGSKFAIYDPRDDLDIMDFDRCSGMFSNCIHVSINDSAAGGGVAFSANSKVLYVSSTVYVYQFDMNAADVALSKTTVAVWDTNYSPSPPAATTFYQSHLAPDNKIYICCTNGTLDIHVIDYPDSIGIACHLCQHCVHLPRYNATTMVNHPNYFLGAEHGSICDSLHTDVPNISSSNQSFNIFPNPVRNILYITQSNKESIKKLTVFNSIGQQQQNISYSSIKNGEYLEVNTSSLLSGVYILEMLTEKQRIVKRFVKE